MGVGTSDACDPDRDGRRPRINRKGILRIQIATKRAHPQGLIQVIASLPLPATARAAGMREIGANGEQPPTAGRRRGTRAIPSGVFIPASRPDPGGPGRRPGDGAPHPARLAAAAWCRPSARSMRLLANARCLACDDVFYRYPRRGAITAAIRHRAGACVELLLRKHVGMQRTACIGETTMRSRSPSGPCRRYRARRAATLACRSRPWQRSCNGRAVTTENARTSG